MIKCSKCNGEPSENDVMGWKCNTCGKAFKVTKSQLHNILMKKDINQEKSYIKCPSCKNILDDGNENIAWKCSCGNINKGKLKDFGEVKEFFSQSNLVKCPECGMEVSSKAKRCVHCGKVFVEEQSKICIDCGKEVPSGAMECPFCGCPVEKKINEDETRTQQVAVASIKMSVKTKKIIICIVIAAILCAGGGIGYRIYSDKKEEQSYWKSYNEYIANLEMAQVLMLSGGSDAESLCNLTLRVWGNAISKEADSETDKYTKNKSSWNDFNTALANLYSDSATITKVSDIESNQTTVKNLIKKLQNPPEGLDKCYDTVSDLYEAYKKLTDLAINPSGSYRDFGGNKNDAVSDFMAAFEKLDNQIPEKTETK